MADNKHDEKHHHHILSDSAGLYVFIALLIFTVITVAAAHMNFGAFNFAIAMFIASVKALMVVLIFMGLKYDSPDNRVIFFSSLFFLGVFIILTSADIFTRAADWRVKGPLLQEVAAQAGATKYKKPWMPSDDLKSRGHEIFVQQCQLCHGAEGKGDGPASAGFNPKPRDFTSGEAWKNGRKVTDVFATLKTGLNSMPSFSQLPVEDRWALAHYVLSLGPTPSHASNEDLKKVGIVDPSKDDGGLSGDNQRKIPIDFAIERYIGNSAK